MFCYCHYYQGDSSLIRQQFSIGRVISGRFFDEFSSNEYSMNPGDVWDLRRVVLKCRRANILDDMSFCQSTDAPRTKALGYKPNVPNVPKNPIFAKERVRAFFRVVGDHQAYKVEFKRHAPMAFESII